MNARKFGTVACTALLKTLVFAFNLVFLTLGLAFFIIGIYGFKMFKEFFSFAPSTTIYLPFICIGLFMIVVGLLSLWCTPKGVAWLLYLYGIIVFILFVAIFSLAVLFMVRRDAFETPLKEGISKAVKTYPNDTAIDQLQTHIRCCGEEDYTDWFATAWANGQKNVPESCCMDKTKCVHQNLVVNKTDKDIYKQGCFKRVHTAVEDNFALIGGINFAAALIILAGSLLSCTLAQNIRSHRYEQME